MNPQLSLPQLKILQEVITLTVFVPALCILAAVYFVFRSPGSA
jgi:uncharacterized protein (DUF486 family)